MLVGAARPSNIMDRCQDAVETKESQKEHFSNVGDPRLSIISS